MGRVSKHKKIKSFDPFYKGPRRVESRSDNLAPTNEDDQPVPKSLIRLMKSASRCTAQSASKQQGTLQLQAGQSTNSNKPRSVDTSTKDSNEGVVFKRRKGESLKSYLERIDIESNERIMEAHRKNKKMSERRKRYMNERKKRLKARKGGGDNDTNSPITEFNDFKDVVRFGEVAHAPPHLSAKPRGTLKKSKGEKLQSLLFQKSLESKKQSSDGKEDCASVVIGLKRKHDLELERERAVDLYRQSKRTKMNRTNGRDIEFHL